jgi:predicted membrane protein
MCSYRVSLDQNNMNSVNTLKPSDNKKFSILEARKKIYYRVLEGLIGGSSILFLLFLVILSIFSPTAAALFLILYSLTWFLKVTLTCIYTLFSFKMIRRYEDLDWRELLQGIEHNPEKAIEILDKAKELGPKSEDWQAKIKSDKKQILEIQNTKWSKISEFYNVIVFITYNESPEILLNSIQAIYKEAFNLSKTVVFISQEERMDPKHNQKTRDYITTAGDGDWAVQVFQENNLDTVLRANHNDLEYSYKDDLKLEEGKLNVFFTTHPDGLVGEIKGSGPNANWGARQVSLLFSHLKIDPETVILTKLDADHQIGPNYLELLTYNYILHPDHPKIGFEPIPVFINNYNQTSIVPRIVGIQNTFWVMTQSILPEEFHFFMCYAIPLYTIREAGFWNCEVISEECFVFYQCFMRYNGNFRTVPVYAPIMVDAVEGLSFFDTIGNQYKQLQRWAWGAIEEFPYIFQRLFLNPEGQKIDTRERIKLIYLNFTNSIFWATSGPMFGFGVFLPSLLGGPEFSTKPISVSLQTISLFFMVFSFALLSFTIYMNYNYLAPKIIIKSVMKNNLDQPAGFDKTIQTSIWNRLKIAFEVVFMPLVYITIMPFPAIDAQIRGMLGKYLGYWVTPKKVAEQPKNSL